ncbi:uncharacterized protein LOC122397938 [Colletes gigas]|uniref:uncharacterized protein LOC122397938 n=1 Tax=Colletes gigas TaxID=935657 RepID=UPI001C9B31CE|nr:uncharacterized protein LOC122397938 [Colletes gigas]
MSDLFKEKYEECITLRRQMKLSGRKWEYPIPKSKEYWEKFCNDEGKKMIVVRDPSLELFRHSFPKNETMPVNFDTRTNNETPNLNSFSDCPIDSCKVSKNSLHKLSPLKSKFDSSKDHHDGRGSFPMSIWRVPAEARSKDPAASFKAAQISKLDSPEPQPSLGRKSNRIRTPFNVQSESIGKKNFPTNFSTLPLSSSRSILPKLPQRRLFPETKSAGSTKNYFRNDIARMKTDEPLHPVDGGGKKVQSSVQDQDSFKYSIRCAYKALKRLTPNKTLNFEPKIIENLSGELVSELNGTSLLHRNESMKLLTPKDSEKLTEEKVELLEKKLERESLKDSRFTDTDSESTTSKLKKTISSGTRFTSGPSLEFVHPKPWKGPSARVLESIPRLSGYPRKNRDRCLVCMYKSFETPLDRKISFPMTVLQKTIISQNACVDSSTFQESESSSTSILNYEDETDKTLNHQIEIEGVTSNTHMCSGPESLIVEHASSLTQGKHGKSVLDSESAKKIVTRKTKEDQRGGDSTLVEKNLNHATNATQAAPLERSKLSTSVRSESSDENDSLAVSVGDDQSKSQYLAPCHAPTIFRPSLEPLRALRNRKPTSLQDRIVLIEASTTRGASSDDYDDIPEKPKSISKSIANKSKTSSGEKNDSPVSRVLTKAKSVSENLSLKNVEFIGGKEHVLERGTSLLNLTAVSDWSKIFYDGTRNELQEFYSSRDNDFSKATPVPDCSISATKLPLTGTDEIAEFLDNLKENASSTSMLETLCKEFSERLAKHATNLDSNDERHSKLAAKLTRLLVDSRLYLCPEKFPSDLLLSTNQSPSCNPRLLRRILPQKSYNLVASLLGLPEWYTLKQISFEDTDGRNRVDRIHNNGETESCDNYSLTSLEVHPPTPRDIESLSNAEKLGQRRYNPYALFLKKPRRKVITWRPLTKSDLEGYDPDATLKMRADNVLTKICRDFCEWLDTLGGTNKTVDEEVLRDMFEIDFNAEACRAMQVSIQEIPVVPAEVALTRNSPGASKLSMTRKHVMRDAKAERTPAKTEAFGTTLPWKLQFVPPNNQVQKNWLQCEYVPKDLETMDVVWKDITHLKSVRGFVEWLQRHPEVPPPEALKTIVSMDLKALRQIEDDEAFAHLELDIDEIKNLRVVDSDDDVE